MGDFNSFIKNLISNHFFSVIFGVIFFVIVLLFFILGFFKFIMIIILTGIGVYIGYHYDKGSNFKELIAKIKNKIK